MAICRGALRARRCNRQERAELAAEGGSGLSHPEFGRRHAVDGPQICRGAELGHGGNPVVIANDVWEGNPDTYDWAALTNVASGLPRNASRMSYDASRQRIVVFGGVTPIAVYPYTALSNHTWECDF
jgi:hypothetical protein